MTTWRFFGEFATILRRWQWKIRDLGEVRPWGPLKIQLDVKDSCNPSTAVACFFVVVLLMFFLMLLVIFVVLFVVVVVAGLFLRRCCCWCCCCYFCCWCFCCSFCSWWLVWRGWNELFIFSPSTKYKNWLFFISQVSLGNGIMSI